ncbi:MAG: phytanoyl-CoA dioxygenase family protein [Pseudomonadales bacterium]|nr:phytanoyl-CoA dioxygenase family protein [Pseudomonadales bacterium]
MFTAKHREQLAESGYCVIEDVLDRAEAADVRARLVAAAQESERRGIPTHIKGLDPDDRNVRVFNLLDLDPVFIELIRHPLALEIAGHLLDDDFIVSNFTANIARPGSRSMVIHSDLAVVLPEPWHAPWSLNVIWCLDDVRGENGGTLFMPGSHHFERLAELPDDIAAKMIPFTAKAGSIVAMEGRLWHTSGENRTRDEERALLFGYYSRSFIRPQWNFNVGLSDRTKAGLAPEMRRLLGLELTANIAPLAGLPDSRTKEKRNHNGST